MRLALVDDFAPALIVGDEVVDVTGALQGLEAAARHRPRRPLARVRLRPPLPAPSKILCCMGGYMEGVSGGVRKGIDMFVKASSAVIGRRTKDIAASEAMRAVFGYVNFIDVSGRGFPLESSIVSVPSFLGKSFDTFAPLGPWITTADEIADVGRLDIRLWVNDEIRQDYSTTDAEHPVARVVAFASSVMTLEPGDIIACGTNHQGLGAVQDGDIVRMEIDGLGPLTVGVRDPLKRTWPRTPDRAFAERVRSRRLPASTP